MQASKLKNLSMHKRVIRQLSCKDLSISSEKHWPEEGGEDTKLGSIHNVLL